MKRIPEWLGAGVFLFLVPILDLVGSEESREEGKKSTGSISQAGNVTDGKWSRFSPSHITTSIPPGLEPLQSSPASGDRSRYYTFPLNFLPPSGFRDGHVPPLTTPGSNQLSEEFPMPLASSSRSTGPYFESNKTTIQISAKAGQNVVLDCSVILLQGRTVSWLRRGKDSLQLLTVGNATYYSDARLGLRFRYPNNWRLGINLLKKNDEGEYHCQLSTHPPKVLVYQLKVIAPAVEILDENGHSVTERHYKVDSSLHLTCRASHVDKFVEKVQWLKGDRVLPGGDSRIKVKVTKSEEVGEASTYLSVLSVRKGDSGNYSCRASSVASSTVTVHVLNGELPAAVQHENCGRKGAPSVQLVGLILIVNIHTRFAWVPVPWAFGMMLR